MMVRVRAVNHAGWCVQFFHDNKEGWLQGSVTYQLEQLAVECCKSYQARFPELEFRIYEALTDTATTVNADSTVKPLIRKGDFVYDPN